MTFKRCSCCNTDKPRSDFGRNAKRKDGLQDHCRVCRSAHYAANADRLKAQFRDSYAAFQAAFVGPRRPALNPRVAAALCAPFGRSPTAMRKRPKPTKLPRPAKAPPPPPVRPMTAEEIAQAEAIIAAHRASAVAAGNAAGSQPKGYRKSNFHRIADAVQARADGIDTAPASSIADDLQARREAALAAAASLVSSAAPVGRVAFVPPSRSC